jgi:hypothetical protein
MRGLFMNGKNISFLSNPIQFLQDNIVNMAELLGADMVSINSNLNLINNSKDGVFDFQEWKGNVKLRFLGSAAGGATVVNDTGVLAYYCPFNGGNQSPPGWVDIPRATALHRFVFTPTMNGCAFVITDSPTPNCFRVHHHQHPISPTNPVEVACVGAANEFDRFTEAEYDIGSTAQRFQNGMFFGTFNFLNYDYSQRRWYYMSSMSEWPSGANQSKWMRALLEDFGFGSGDNVPWRRPANYHPVSRQATT